jgi:type VI protein secretion system component VasK
VTIVASFDHPDEPSLHRALRVTKDAMGTARFWVWVVLFTAVATWLAFPFIEDASFDPEVRRAVSVGSILAGLVLAVALFYLAALALAPFRKRQLRREWEGRGMEWRNTWAKPPKQRRPVL